MAEPDKFSPVDQSPGRDDLAPNFVVTPDGIELSPDEAWIIKRALQGTEQGSDYHNLYETLSGQFVSGTYEKAPTIKVATKDVLPLAGAYMSVFWELQGPEDVDKAQVVKEKIEKLIEGQPDSVREFFRNEFKGPKFSPTRDTESN